MYLFVNLPDIKREFKIEIDKEIQANKLFELCKDYLIDEPEKYIIIKTSSKEIINPNEKISNILNEEEKISIIKKESYYSANIEKKSCSHIFVGIFGIIGSLIIFFTGISLSQLSSISGNSIAEAYYQSIGIVCIGASFLSLSTTIYMIKKLIK